MFLSLPKLSVHIFALGALLISIPTQILSLPDILNPELKTIYEALKARDPKFDARLSDAIDMSERDLCEMRHEIDSPEQIVLAQRPTRAIGEAAQAIKNACNENIECIENELKGELGEFIELMLNPKRLRKENNTTNQRFHALYNKYADTFGFVTKSDFKRACQAAESQAPAPTSSQPQTTVTWEAGQSFLQDYNLTAQRLATFMRIVAANVNDQPDEQLRTSWNNHIKNAQKDAKNLYDTYCPYTITRRLSNLVSYPTLGFSRFFSPSWNKCNACDTLAAIVDGNVYKEAEDKATMLVKGDPKNFKFKNGSGPAEAFVARDINLPMAAMLNPATLASTVMN